MSKKVSSGDKEQHLSVPSPSVLLVPLELGLHYRRVPRLCMVVVCSQVFPVWLGRVGEFLNNLPI